MPTGKLDPLTVLLFIGVFLSATGLVLAYHFYPEESPLVRGYIDSIAGAFAVSFFGRVGYHFVAGPPPQPGANPATNPPVMRVQPGPAPAGKA